MDGVIDVSVAFEVYDGMMPIVYCYMILKKQERQKRFSFLRRLHKIDNNQKIK